MALPLPNNSVEDPEVRRNFAKLALQFPVAEDGLQDGSVTTAKLADNSVTSVKIVDGTIVTADLADNAVTNPKLADNAVNTAEIVDSAVTSAKIASETIVEGDLANSAVTGAKLADNAVTSTKIQDASVQHGDIATGTSGLAVGCFSAYPSSAQTGIVTSTFTKVVFGSEDWDISNWFDPSTSRFTPQIAGYYRLSCGVEIATTVASGTRLIVQIRKNGSDNKRLMVMYVTGGDDAQPGGSCLVTANGSSDYFEVWFHHNHASNISLQGGIDLTWFQGELVGKS